VKTGVVEPARFFYIRLQRKKGIKTSNHLKGHRKQVSSKEKMKKDIQKRNMKNTSSNKSVKPSFAGGYWVCNVNYSKSMS
jgi:regulator of replication initiation timing